jgi:hypothetical protein
LTSADLYVLLLFMSRQPEKQARAEAMLGEIAELGLMVAKELAARLRASEDVDETVALAGAFQKASRAVRLTVALDFKLDRDAAREAAAQAREARDAEAEAQARAAANAPTDYDRRQANPIEARKTRVRNLLNRLLWNECEGDSEEFEVLSDDLAARLDEAARSGDFETLPIEVLAARVIADMGLSGELTLSLREAQSTDAGPGAPERRSSA